MKLADIRNKIFNPYIRERDNEKIGGCICCGAEIQDSSHFYSVGANPHLQLVVNNAYGSCRACNRLHDTQKNEKSNLRKAIIHHKGILILNELEEIKRATEIWGWMTLREIAELYKYLRKNKIYLYSHNEVLKYKNDVL